jgi:hypothetical protein
LKMKMDIDFSSRERICQKYFVLYLQEYAYKIRYIRY